MATSTPNKTDTTEVLPHSACIHPGTIVGSAINCSTKRAVVIELFHGYVEAAADTNPGQFMVQVRAQDGASAVNEHWQTVFVGKSKGTTPDDETLTGSESDNSLAVAATAGFAVLDELYIQDTNGGAPAGTTGTLTGAELNSEWATCKTFVTNTNIQLFDNLTNAKDSSDKIFNDASKFTVALDLNGIESFRVIWTHEGAAGANGHVYGIATFYDSDNIA